MAERMRATIPVFVFLVDDQERIYLQRRYQTGYMDGFYEPPAGKVDDGEFPRAAASREVLEEAGVIVDPEDLELFHTYINLTGNKPWLGLMFRTRRWTGIPVIEEPEKCDYANFFAIDALPQVTEQVRAAIGRLVVASSIGMSEYMDS